LRLIFGFATATTTAGLLGAIAADVADLLAAVAALHLLAVAFRALTRDVAILSAVVALLTAIAPNRPAVVVAVAKPKIKRNDVMIGPS